tara:strand:+ start:751 stop:1302 length:552 start_codon:yes stop_codon:yes gene_type:complete
MAYGKVLAVLTGDDTDQGVLAQGADMVRRVKGTLFAVYVITVDRALPVDAEVGPAAARGEGILHNAETSVQLPRGDFEAQLLQARELGPAVVFEAAERDVDAIVIGTSCPSDYGHFSLGVDVPYVLEHARCLVVLWREPPTQGRTRPGSRRSWSGRALGSSQVSDQPDGERYLTPMTTGRLVT